MQNQNPKLVFFGTSRFSVIVLETLEKHGLRPELVIATPDAPVGRRQVLTPPLTKIWAEEKSIPVLQPKQFDKEVLTHLKNYQDGIFLVASYGKILPKEVIDIPNYKTLNIHPSLLPHLRGASPLQSTILLQERPGVTIIVLDEEMDHGPILGKEEVQVSPSSTSALSLEAILAEKGAELFMKILPKWTQGTLSPTPQNHDEASYTEKIKKEHGEITLEGNAEENYRKFLAYTPWPGVFFFALRNGKKIRVLVKAASYENGVFNVLRVLPEGKKEMSFEEFLRGNH